MLPRLFLAALAATALAVNIPGCEEKKPLIVGDLVIVHAVPLQWTELEKGLQYTRLEFTRQADGQNVMAAVLSVDPKKFRFSLLNAPEIQGQPSAWVSDLAKKAGAVAAVNASFYLPETYEPIGLLVARGKVIHPWHQAAGSGIFWYDHSSAAIEWAKEYRDAWEQKELAIQAGPLIVEPKGEPGIYQDRQKYRSRTAIGLDPKGHVILLCTFRQGQEELDLSGLDLYELMEIARLPARHGGLGLDTVLNLDGGTSSALYLKLPQLQLEIKSTHPVRNAVAVIKK
ncbi:MAG TPA: phosphodiester glycosidase family protein [bacterium]|nr:phosphodiester glycosidase family protein [bacterium]